MRRRGRPVTGLHPSSPACRCIQRASAARACRSRRGSSRTTRSLGSRPARPRSSSRRRASPHRARPARPRGCTARQAAASTRARASSPGSQGAEAKACDALAQRIMASAANSGATLDETPVPTPGAARCARARVCGACRRPGEGAAARLARHRHARRAGVRRRPVVPGADGDLRAALRVGLPRVAAEALAAHRRGAAGDHRRREDLDHPDEAGHPLHRRPGLRRQAARAHRRRLRLFVQALDGPERAARRRPDPHGPPDRRARGRRRGAHVGQVRLRQADRRAPRARSLHAAAQADRGELSRACTTP